MSIERRDLVIQPISSALALGPSLSGDRRTSPQDHDNSTNLLDRTMVLIYPSPSSPLSDSVGQVHHLLSLLLVSFLSARMEWYQDSTWMSPLDASMSLMRQQ